jgi:hypothetical protein
VSLDTGPTFRSSLRSAVPKWLLDLPGMLVGFQFLYTMVGLFDRGVQALLEGTRASMPGSDSRTDNLELVGQSRMRLQGESETDAHFIEVTLFNWLSDLRQLGGEIGVAKELNRWIGGNPMVRVISRSGLYTTCVSVDGVQTVSQVLSTWNWDSVSNPERQSRTPGSAGYFDYWIVVYAPTNANYVATTGHWGDGQDHAPGTTQGIGLTITPQEIQTIRGLLRTWLGAQVTPRTLIWSYDSAAFDPATPARSGNPDGTWGRWYNVSTWYASRNRTHRYTSLGPERP